MTARVGRRGGKLINRRSSWVGLALHPGARRGLPAPCGLRVSFGPSKGERTGQSPQGHGSRSIPSVVLLGGVNAAHTQSRRVEHGLPTAAVGRFVASADRPPPWTTLHRSTERPSMAASLPYEPAEQPRGRIPERAARRYSSEQRSRRRARPLARPARRGDLRPHAADDAPGRRPRRRPAVAAAVRHRRPRRARRAAEHRLPRAHRRTAAAASPVAGVRRLRARHGGRLSALARAGAARGRRHARRRRDRRAAAGDRDRRRGLVAPAAVGGLLALRGGRLRARGRASRRSRAAAASSPPTRCCCSRWRARRSATSPARGSRRRCAPSR